MASLRNWYLGQLVTQADMRGGDAALQGGDLNVVADNGFFGVMSGHVVSAQGPATLSLDITAGLSYSPLGERIRSAGAATLDTTFDYLGVPTAVLTNGKSRILSVFAVFDRTPSDPRIDATNTTVYFVQDESFRFIVVAGAEAISPTAPALLADGVLLCDATLAYGQTTIASGDLSTTRRQDLLVLTGTPFGTGGTGGRYGSYKAALQAIVSRYDGLVSGGGDQIAAASITYAGSGTWVNGLTGIAAGSVEAAIDAVVAALGSTVTSTAGGDRLGVPSDATQSPTLAAGDLTTRLAALRLATNLYYAGGPSWVNSAANNAGTIEATLDQLFTDLASVTNSGRGVGAAKIGMNTIGNFTTSSVQQYFVELIATTNANDGAKRIGANATGGFSGVTVRGQLDELRAGGTFTGQVTFGGGLYPQISPTQTLTRRSMNLYALTYNGTAPAGPDAWLEVSTGVVSRIHSAAQTTAGASAVIRLEELPEGASVTQIDIVSGGISGQGGGLNLPIYEIYSIGAGPTLTQTSLSSPTTDTHSTGAWNLVFGTVTTITPTSGSFTVSKGNIYVLEVTLPWNGSAAAAMTINDVKVTCSVSTLKV